MFWKKRILILLGALLFSFGMLSLGYAFWTDSLELEGNANVSLSMPVIDDVEETASPEAVMLVEVPALESGDGSGSSPIEPSAEDIIPIITEPTETDPVIAPSDQGQVDTTPVIENPVDTPPDTETVDALPVTEDPVDTSSETEQVDTPSVTEAPSDTPSSPEPVDTPPESTESNGEGNS